MPPLSFAAKLVVGTIAGLFGILAAIMITYVDKRTIYWIRVNILHEKRGRPPTGGRSPLIWGLFIVSAVIAAGGTAIVAAASSPTELAQSTQTPTYTSNVIQTLTPSSSLVPTQPQAAFPVPVITQVAKGFDTAGYGKLTSLVRDSQGNLTLFVRDLSGQLAFMQSSDGAKTWSAPNYFFQTSPPGTSMVSSVVDSADQIHIVWGRVPDASDVHYGLLIGQKWSVQDQIVGTGSFARDIAVDSANHPHIVWSGIGIFHISYDGLNWIEPPDSVLPVGWHPDIQIDADDKVLLFLNDSQFYPSPGASVYEIDNIGGHWNNPVKLSTSPFWSGGAAAALDSQDNIYVTWMGATTANGGQDQVFFSRFVNGQWQSPFPIGNVNTSAGSTGQESPSVAFDSNNVFYVFWRGLNSDNHPVIFARALVTEDNSNSTVTAGWSPTIELRATDASNVGWPSVADVWHKNRTLGVDLVWSATVGKDKVVEYAHVKYP